MKDEQILAWLRLARLPGVGPVLARRLLGALGSPQAVLEAEPARLASVEGIGTKTASAIRAGAAGTLEEARRELELARGAGVTLLALDDPAYPQALASIHDPPLVLYVRGTLERRDKAAIGIVGARQCTLYGRETAGRFGRQLAEAGLTVISGGARGIDTCAHEGALLARGRTVVVQGCGLFATYPPENKKLYERIVAERAGAIVSDFPLETPPLKENFPPRNRIIAGMSLGVLVVEANLRSGSLITARLAAADYGREVFAVPGRIDSPASAGTHHLIKTMAAHLVEGVEDILEQLGEVGAALRGEGTTITETRSHEDVKGHKDGDAAGETPLEERRPEAPAAIFTPVQRTILSAMDGTPVSVEEMMERTGLSPAVVMAELTMLQIGGIVARAGGNRFVKGRK
jgi:DNA processing protein